MFRMPSTFYKNVNDFYTSHKKFMNTSISTESVASFMMEGRNLESQTWQAIDILNGFISLGP